jgi:phage terminase large subunit
LQGGTRSGKTFAMMQFIIYLCHSFRPLEIDICRDTFVSLRGTVYKEFLQLLRKYHVNFEHNKSEHIITINGNVIHFYGLDNDEKIHGKERDIIWINEINQIKSEVYDQIAPRTRHRIIGDYNPRLGRRHWLDPYIDKFPPLITTYKDNPFLTKIQIEDIESKKSDPYWWAIYGDGKRAAMEGAIFENWDFGNFDETLPYCYGQDFGFSNDPTTLVRVAVDEIKKTIYLDECFYNNKELTTEQIYEFNKSYISRSNDLIIADSAEPRLIYEIAAKGMNIQKATKGSGSVLYGIQKMKEYKIVITDNSRNLEKELSSYIWNDKKAGIPIDKDNHIIDAARYAFMRLTNNTGFNPIHSDNLL